MRNFASKNMKRIHIITPSGAIDPALIDGATERLKEWGFRVTEGAHARMPEGRFGGTREGRIADLNEALADPDIDYILCSRGGYGIAQIVDSIRVPEIATFAEGSMLMRMPQVVGFSDVTVLHCLMGTRDIPSLHAVMCKHLTEFAAREESCEALRKALMGAPLEYTLPAHPLNRTGKAEGLLRGGNLSVFYGLQATPYAVRTDGSTILFIEDVGERPYAIDRMMHNLRLSGVLEHLSGLVVGQFSDYDEDPLMPGTVYSRIREMVEPYDYPLIFDFPAGHVSRNLPLWMNKTCSLEVTEQGARLVQA